jgi:hypothetical protein
MAETISPFDFFVKLVSKNKKARDTSKLKPERKAQQNLAHPEAALDKKGIGGDVLIEPVPNYISAPCEKVISNANNASIVLGRDRVGGRMTGYGGRGDTQAASIDIVAGRLGHKANEDYCDPSFNLDAARIYISQKTDVDKNFGISKGRVGDTRTKSAVAIKADAVRIIARENIKIVTRTDIRNSQGGYCDATQGIDLMAGNMNKHPLDLQPLVKGGNLVTALQEVCDQLDDLNGICTDLLLSQMEMNEAVISHFHQSPFFAGPTTPSLVLIPRGVKVMIDHLRKSQRSLLSQKANLVLVKMAYLSPTGAKYINSRHNTTN